MKRPCHMSSSLQPRILRQLSVVIGTNFQMFNTGYGIGVTSPMIVQLTGLLLGEGTTSWFASSLVLGQVLGSLLGSFLANRIGRKKTCMLAALASCLGWSVLSASQHYWMLILGRVLTGTFDCLGVAGSYMYISEVSEYKLKGSFLNSTAIASGLGIAFGYLFGSNIHWRHACFVAILSSISSIVTFLFCYESPVYLLMKNEGAKECLQWFRQQSSVVSKDDDQEIERELKEMEFEVSASGQSVRDSVKRLFQGNNRKAFATVTALFMFFPLTGVYNISFFAVDLFNKLELGGAEVVAVFTALVRCLGTCCSSLLLLRYGRRTIYLTTSVLVTLIMGTLGALVIMKESGVRFDEIMISWVMTILLILFMFCVGVAIVSFPWILMAEWFPPDLKSLVNTSLITFSFLMIFLAVQTSNIILGFIGTGGLFLYFCGICFLMTIFIAVFVPETHGKMYNQT